MWTRAVTTLVVALALIGLAECRKRATETGMYGAFDRLEIDETKIPPDVYYEMHLLVPDTIRYRGYQCEEHEVTTEDGYVLTLHRVLPSPSTSKEKSRSLSLSLKGSVSVNESRPAVFMQHGLMDSSFTWVNNLPYQSLAYILADKGFDVWLGNSRGNKYSRKHVTLNPDTDKAFWEWDYDQLAAYDASASIDYVLQATGRKTLSWVGHSQGCMIALAGLINETVGQKVNLFVALAPAARVDHIENELMLKLAPYAVTIENVLGAFGWVGEFLPNDNLYTWLGGTVCSNVPIICEDLINFLAGYDSPDMNATRLPVYFTHFPAGTSGQNVVHYAQAVEQAKFQHFDYGVVENLKRYHSRTPPPYDLTQLKVPTAVFWGGKDKLADPTDVKWIIDQLPNLVLEKKFDDLAHADFVMGVSANTLIYPTVIDLLNQFK